MLVYCNKGPPRLGSTLAAEIPPAAARAGRGRYWACSELAASHCVARYLAKSWLPLLQLVAGC